MATQPATITRAQLRAKLRAETKRLRECRDRDFGKGRVTHSAATDDALSRVLLLEELLAGELELEETSSAGKRAPAGNNATLDL